MKSIFIEKYHDYIRMALKDKDELQKLFIEEYSDNPRIGQIYKGTVKNIINGNRCAFIDIGYHKNCYMYLDNNGEKNLKKGDDIIVEVIREETGDKGPKVTDDISIQGSYCVLTTFNSRVNFSKNIQDYKLKKTITEGIKKPEDVGLIIRTKGAEAKLEDINIEIEYLYGVYTGVIKKGKYSLKPKLLYDNGRLLDIALREFVDESAKEIIVNSNEYYDYIKNYISSKKNLTFEVTLHEGEQNLFCFYGIEKDILQLRNNRVNLNCGGYIVIDKTEAMYVIDVNTGKNIKHESMRKTVLSTNMEAAEEIAKQIKLRNLAGIIIVDFIDMHDDEDRRKIMETFRNCLMDDKVKTKVYPFTQLNLLQITRKRNGKDIYDYLEEECKKCKGTGGRLKFSYIKFLIKNEILKMKGQCGMDNIYIEVQEMYKKDISEDVLNFVKDIDSLGKKVYVNYVSEGEYFKVEPLLFASQIKNLEAYRVYG